MITKRAMIRTVRQTVETRASIRNPRWSMVFKRTSESCPTCSVTIDRQLTAASRTPIGTDLITRDRCFFRTGWERQSPDGARWARVEQRSQTGDANERDGARMPVETDGVEHCLGDDDIDGEGDGDHSAQEPPQLATEPQDGRQRQPRRGERQIQGSDDATGARRSQ
jgi:hypothetical protein